MDNKHITNKIDENEILIAKFCKYCLICLHFNSVKSPTELKLKQNKHPEFSKYEILD